MTAVDNYKPVDVSNNALDIDLNAQILQILNDNINNAIVRIKQKLGNDTNSVDAKVLRIVQTLDLFKNEIDDSITTNYSDVTDTDQYRIKIDDRRENVKDVNYYSGIKEASYKNTTIQTLDEQENLAGINTDAEKLNLNNANNVARVQTRLNNCHKLEMLYLIKHEELMKTFSLTLKLFDKYKYSIKMNLYLLKHLVKKQLPTGVAPTAPSAGPNIDLPRPIIKNLRQLLDDQNNVQQVIDNLNTRLMGNGDINQVITGDENEFNIRPNLTDKTTP